MSNVIEGDRPAVFDGTSIVPFQLPRLPLQVELQLEQDRIAFSHQREPLPVRGILFVTSALSLVLAGCAGGANTSPSPDAQQFHPPSTAAPLPTTEKRSSTPVFTPSFTATRTSEVNKVPQQQTGIEVIPLIIGALNISPKDFTEKFPSRVSPTDFGNKISQLTRLLLNSVQNRKEGEMLDLFLKRMNALHNVAIRGSYFPGGPVDRSASTKALDVIYGKMRKLAEEVANAGGKLPKLPMHIFSLEVGCGQIEQMILFADQSDMDAVLKSAGCFPGGPRSNSSPQDILEGAARIRPNGTYWVISADDGTLYRNPDFGSVAQR